MQHQHELPVLGGIAAAIRWVEELVSLLSGPLLTIGLGIALIDLLTGGGLLRTVPELLYCWAVSMAVGIDAQLVATWDRVRMSARRKHWASVAGYVVLGCALGYVGFLSAEAFGLQQAFGLSESDALSRLGIDAASWQLQRAVLAVFLVALSGFTRYHAPPKQKQTLEDERAALARELELEPLRQRLRAQKAVGVAALARQAISAATGREPSDVPVVNTESTPQPKPPTGPGTPGADVTIANGYEVEIPPEVKRRRPEPAIRLIPDTPRRRRGATPRVRTVDNGEALARAAWASGARSRDKLAAATGLSPTAAASWVRTLKAEAKAREEQPQQPEAVAL